MKRRYSGKKAIEVIARGKRIRQIRKERLKAELKALDNVKKTSTASKIFNFIFIIAVFIGLIIYIIKVDGLNNILNVLRNAHYGWIAIGILCLCAEWILEAIVMHIPLKKMYSNLKYITSLRTNIIGRLFNNITPFSSGGQPFQAYILSKYGLRASDTFSVLMMKFVVYQVSVFTWAVILLIINFTFWNETFKNYIGLVVIGFILNLVATLFIFVAGINKNIIIKIGKPLIKLGSKIKIGKIHIVKDYNSSINKMENSVSNYSNQFNAMKNEKIILLKMYFFSILQLLAYLSIPFMIYKAFGNTGVSYIQILTIQTYLLLFMSFIPTPGSGLGAEGGFALFYSTVFLSGLSLAVLFWRLYTFYSPIIVGIIVFELMNRREVKKEIKTEKEKEILYFF